MADTAAVTPFVVLVTGSRKWRHASVIRDQLALVHAEHGERLIVRHGGAGGADEIADAWCRRYGVPVERFSADWSKGRGAGHARNAVMVNRGADVCLAFILDASPGATGCARLAEAAGIPTIRFELTTEDPDGLHP